MAGGGSAHGRLCAGALLALVVGADGSGGVSFP